MILKKQILLISASALIAYSGHSQLNIKSRVIDSTSKLPVAFATVIIYKIAQPEKPVYTSLTEQDGSFSFKIADSAQYRLTVQHAVYEEKKIDFILSIPDPITVVPKVKSMTAVTVTAKKPLIERIEDKIIFNVESDPSLIGLMATDALEKTPFISVDGDGNVQMKGQSNFKVLIDGKESALFASNPSEALRTFPASNIKRIEVITNPSVKYDAEGTAGIINIVTRKKTVGYNASTELYYNTNNVYNIHTILNAKRGKAGFSGAFSMGKYKTPALITRNTTDVIHPVTYSKRTITGSSITPGNWIRSNAELNLDIDSLKLISFYGSFNDNDRRSSQYRQVSVINTNPSGIENYSFRDTMERDFPSTDMGVDFFQRFRKKKGLEWSGRINYNRVKDNNFILSDQSYSAFERFAINENYFKSSQLTVQADIYIPLANSGKIETGTKAILRNASETYQALFRYDPTKEFSSDPFNTDTFHYDQDIYSVYFSWSFKIKSWNLRFGIRVEHTEIEGDFASSTTKIKQSYTHFIPAVLLFKKLNEYNDISLNYTQRLNRPTIFTLNPLINNSDSLNITSGNPQLATELTHSFEIGYGFSKNGTSMNLRLSQNYCSNQVTQYALLNETTGVLWAFPDNIGRNHFTALNGNLSVKILKIWTTNINNGIQYAFIENTRNKNQRNDGFSGFANITNTFNVYKNIRATAGASYTKPAIQLQGENGGFFSYGGSVNNRFFQNKLLVSIGVALFLQKKRYTRSFFRDENFIQSNLTETRAFRMGFSVRWFFGKLKEKVSRKTITENDDNKEN